MISLTSQSSFIMNLDCALCSPSLSNHDFDPLSSAQCSSNLTFPQPSHRHQPPSSYSAQREDAGPGAVSRVISENFREVLLTALPRMQGRIGCTDLITDWDEWARPRQPPAPGSRKRGGVVWHKIINYHIHDLNYHDSSTTIQIAPNVQLQRSINPEEMATEKFISIA